MNERTATGPLAGYDFSEAVSYHRGKFPPKSLDLERLIAPLGKAREALARYDQMLKTLRNGELLLAPMRRQEAVVSSRIEGTVTTLDALLQYEADGETEPVRAGGVRNETLETYLYARAMREAESALLDGWPISEALLRQTHQTLLGSGRGRDKRPGDFKIEQNYVADKLRKRVQFIPVEPVHLQGGIDAFLRYVNSDDVLDPLIRTAIAHAEFEALHPFDDGNGRIGRMFVTLMLWRDGMIGGPYFFLSAHFEREKDEYIERLRKVSEDDDWSGWCAFFFEALAAAAMQSLETAERIAALYEEMRERFRAATGSQWHVAALDYVFEHPAFRNNRFAEQMTSNHGVAPATANRFTRELANQGLLTVVIPGSGRAPTLYSFEPLLEILRV